MAASSIRLRAKGPLLRSGVLWKGPSVGYAGVALQCRRGDPSTGRSDRSNYFCRLRCRPSRGSRYSEKWRCLLPTRLAYETLLYDVSDGVATVTLNQPDTRNALSNEVLGELIDAFEAARDDDAVRCVVLTSSHDRVFSSGANLSGFAGDVPIVHRYFGTEKFPQLFRLIGTLGKPTICAANGHVLAGALGIALACDLILAKETATFGTPEIN